MAQYQHLPIFKASYDLHLIPDNRYAYFVEQTTSIAKQSNGWLASVIV